MTGSSAAASRSKASARLHDAAALAPNEFQVGESICSGDSGGPAFASTNAIVGIVSRGGNNTQPDPNNPSRPASAREHLHEGRAVQEVHRGRAGPGRRRALVRGGPDPRLAKTDAPCAAAAECRSNLCVADPSQQNAMACAQDCSTDPTACPTVRRARPSTRRRSVGRLRPSRPPTTRAETAAPRPSPRPAAARRPRW